MFEISYKLITTRYIKKWQIIANECFMNFSDIILLLDIWYIWTYQNMWVQTVFHGVIIYEDWL